MSKGSQRRRQAIDHDTMQANWERIFKTKSKLQVSGDLPRGMEDNSSTGTIDRASQRESREAEQA